MHKVKTIKSLTQVRSNKPKHSLGKTAAILGVVWIVSFVCTMLAVDPQYQMLGLLSNHSHHIPPHSLWPKRLKAFP